MITVEYRPDAAIAEGQKHCILQLCLSCHEVVSETDTRESSLFPLFSECGPHFLDIYSSGVGLWNAVVTMDSSGKHSSLALAIIKIRHIAVDCMYMAVTAHEGISSRFEIDEGEIIPWRMRWA